jgi:tartrate-resistant acid phosphatase type 5
MKKFLIGTLLVIIITVSFLFYRNNSQKNTQISTTLPTTFISPFPIELPTDSFIMLADTGTGLKGQQQVADAIEQYCKDVLCQSAFIAGDVIYDLGVSSVDDSQFQTKFENIYKKNNIPFYIAFGNHDYEGCTQCYIDYAKKSKKWKMPAAYYKTSFESIDFFIIDTEKFDKTQQSWLQKQLKTSTKKWKIVVGHRPITTYEDTHSGELWSGRKELLNMICNEADIYVAGHSHILEDVGRFPKCKAIQLVNGGGGAFPRDILPDHKDIFHFENHGFLTVELQADNLTYSFIGTDSAVLHSKSLEKK